MMYQFKLEIFFKNGDYFVWVHPTQCCVTIQNNILIVKSVDSQNNASYYNLDDIKTFVFYNY